MKVTGEIAVKVERDLLEKLDAIKRDNGFTDEEWGRLAFEGEEINFRRKIQNLKSPQANGLPQRLNVGDFVRLCAPFKKDPARLLSDVLTGNGL